MFLLLLGVVLFLAHLCTGSVALSINEVWNGLMGHGESSRNIVRLVRLPGAVTALLAGAGLAASGLMMQTLFRNPLAGPSVLGISSGANLGVAVLMLAQPLWSMLPIPRDIALVTAALGGAMGVLILIVMADRRLGDGITLLIVGLMVSYLCSALISVLQVASPAAALKSYILWGMGSFADVGPQRMVWFALPVVIGIIGSLLLIKPLNALLLGEAYAATMGVEVKKVRTRILWITGILAGTITAFCGPIAFLGLATPHVARALIRTSDHGKLLPATLICGGVLALLCDVIIKLPGVDHAVPLNAVTSLLGVPVVIWVLLSGKRWAHSA